MSDWEALDTRNGLTPVPTNQIRVGHDLVGHGGIVTEVRTSTSGLTVWLTSLRRNGTTFTNKVSARSITLVTNYAVGDGQHCAACGSADTFTAHWDSPTGTDVVVWSCPEHGELVETYRNNDGTLAADMIPAPRPVLVPFAHPDSRTDVPMPDPNKIEDWECARYRHEGEHAIEFADTLVPSATQWQIRCSEHGVGNGIPAKRFRASGGAL